MHTKIYAFVLALLVLIASLTLPVLAVETEVSPEPEVTSEGSEPVEGVSDASEQGSENMVVDISEESIDAIAMAISGDDYEYLYAYQYTIEVYDPNTGNTLTFILDTNTSYLLTEQTFEVVSPYLGEYWLVYLGQYEGKSSVGCYMSGQFFVMPPNGGVTSFESINDLGSDTSSELLEGGILWSNYDIYNTDDVLIFESTYSPPKVLYVYYQTGFDDLVIKETKWEKGYLPPEPEYDGYIFMGWYYDREYTIPYDYPAYEDIQGDLTLYAKWRPVPQMSFVHETIFDSLIAFFSYEPIFYILSLFGTVIIFGVIRLIIGSRYC